MNAASWVLVETALLPTSISSEPRRASRLLGRGLGQQCLRAWRMFRRSQRQPGQLKVKGQHRKLIHDPRE